MARTSRAGMLALMLSFAACRGAGYWMDRLQAQPLYQRANAVRASSACSRLIPVEFGRTFPVPVRRDGRPFYGELFYPAAVSPGAADISAPTAAGFFAARAPQEDLCVGLPSGATLPERVAAAAGLSAARRYRLESRLYERLERVGELYFRGGSVTPQERQALVDYADAFRAVAEPVLLPDYYRLNSDFWEWLRREAGRSIPKPSP